MSSAKRLEDGATIAIIGGGPAGAFSAIHLLKQAKTLGYTFRVIIFEARCKPPGTEDSELAGAYVGCPQCAGGLSPRLHDVMVDLGISLPPEVIQARISSLTVQGNWKSIYLPVPPGRSMVSVFRGTLPFGREFAANCFDGTLLSAAADAGAEVVGSRVFRIVRDNEHGINLSYQLNNIETVLKAEFVVFAGGVNQKTDRAHTHPTSMELFRNLQPDYIPPRLRKAIIFELETEAEQTGNIDGQLHYIESSSGRLRLDMCSMLSKRGYLTITLVGQSVDDSNSHQENLNVIKDFLGLPQIRRILPAQMHLHVRCICNPSLVVGTANMPFGERVAAVGDMATSRQYKDGILAAHNMAKSLAETVVTSGVDCKSLAKGYGGMIESIQKDNRFAAVIFVLYRWFFINPLLGRIIYQAFATEKKTKTESQRKFKNIFWAISSGDMSYREIAWAMLRPETLWLIFSGGFIVTVRNLITEFLFGISWRGVPRFTTAVSKDDLAARRHELLPARTWSGSDGWSPEFECIYSIRVRSKVETVRSLLAQFGEKNRPYLNPLWVKIRRSSGEPLHVGSVIQYEVFWGAISFSIEQQASSSDNLIVYKVNGGFADGGLFCFEVKPLPGNLSLATVYLVFDYARGETVLGRLYCRLFRMMFPEFIHDVLWNHALCKLKHVAELRETVSWDMGM